MNLFLDRTALMSRVSLNNFSMQSSSATATISDGAEPHIFEGAGFFRHLLRCLRIIRLIALNTFYEMFPDLLYARTLVVDSFLPFYFSP